MNDRDVINFLWRHGYAWRLGIDDYDSIRYLELSNPIVCDMVAEFQRFNCPLMDQFARSVYGEKARLNGEYGTATELAMAVPRCPVPDFPPNSTTIFRYSDPNLQKIVERMQAIGSGSWPMPCQKEGTTFSVNKSRMPDAMADRIEAIIDDVVADYAKHGWRLERVQVNTGENISVSWEVLQGSVIGLAEFNFERCNDNVFCKLDPGYYPNDDQIRQLLQHELGHNANLPHTSGGVMNPSILAGWVGFVSSDPSVPLLKRFFGGEPLDPIGPEPSPPTGNATIAGVLTLRIDGKEKGKFILVPHVEV